MPGLVLFVGSIRLQVVELLAGAPIGEDGCQVCAVDMTVASDIANAILGVCAWPPESEDESQVTAVDLPVVIQVAYAGVA